MIHLEVFTVCAKIEKDNRGNTNLIGMFTDTLSPRLPAVHEFWSFASVRMDDEQDREKYEFRLKVVDPSGNTIAQGGWKKLHIELGNRGANIRTQLRIKIGSEGDHHIEFWARECGETAEGNKLGDSSTFRSILTTQTPDIVIDNKVLSDPQVVVG